ncbi:MAG: hypothetical protein WB815_05270 [Nitrososphaeraceae archaeon]
MILGLFAIGFASILAIPLSPAYSDSMTGGALSQRIGGFDVELKTEPAAPVAGERTSIFVRIGSINGYDAVDTPISIKVTKQGDEVHKSNTVFVPNGHYTYTYNFAEPGVYGINILIQDTTAFGETRSTSSFPLSSQSQSILFTFPVSVQSKSLLVFSGLQLALILAVVAVVCAIIVFYLKAKRNHRERSYQPTGMT